MLEAGISPVLMKSHTAGLMYNPCMRLWRLSLLLLAGLCLALAGARAWANHPETDMGPQTPPLPWKASYLRDATGHLTPAEVARRPEMDLTPMDQTLSIGFTRDAVWVRVNIDRPTEDLPHTWWLELDQSVIEDAVLYVADGQGGWAPVRRLAHRQPLFGLRLETTGVQTFWLRLATRTSVSGRLVLWYPENMLQSEAREAFVWGSMFGAYSLVAAFYLAFWAWTRERIHLIYTAYVLANLSASYLTAGWPAQFMPDVDGHLWIDLLGLSLSLSMAIACLFSITFLGLDQRWPRPSRWLLWATWACSLVGVLGSLAGHYGVVVPIVQTVTVAVIVAIASMALRLAREGRPDARLFLSAFSVYYLGVAWRYARNFGLIEPTFWNDNSYQFGAFIHIIVMSTAIFSGYNRMRREKEAAEARAGQEAQLRAEQRDFTSMVSHEFRTPLSIIDASADNLLKASDLQERSRQRVEKILKASARMRSLMEHYLASERQLLDRRPLEKANMDVAALCRRLALDLAEAQNSPIHVNAPAQFTMTCDANLLEIALHNLLTNAIRHGPPKEAVILELGLDTDGVRFEVRDKGPGIPPDEVAHIFERFYRGRGASEKPGAGLGLYLVRSIAERHGGRVEVRNLAGGGCAFILHLPD